MPHLYIFPLMLNRFFLGLILILTSISLTAGELNYRFKWLAMPVANLSIISDENQLFFDEVNFDLSTRGPLKLYRNYSSGGYIKKHNEDSWDYYLSGMDRGEREEKLISYYFGHQPLIRKFIDDSGVKQLSLDSLNDKQSIDPFSVFLKTIENLRLKKNCDGSYVVMDGKRRYKVEVRFISEELLTKTINSEYVGNSYLCRMTVSNRELSINKRKNNWPFDNGEKTVDIWFAKDFNFHAVKFVLKAPIGRLIGSISLD